MNIRTIVVTCAVGLVPALGLAQNGDRQQRPETAQQQESANSDSRSDRETRDQRESSRESRERREERERRHHEDDLNYSYLEMSSLDYDMDIGGIDVEPDGYRFELGLSLGDSLFGVINRSRTDGKFAGVNYDFDTQGYGFGFRGDSWFASYTYNTWEFADNEFDVDTIRVGFRNKWTERLEFNASYSWNNIEGADNDDGLQAGFAYELWDDFHLVADYETIGGQLDIDYISLGVRFDF